MWRIPGLLAGAEGTDDGTENELQNSGEPDLKEIPLSISQEDVDRNEDLFLIF